MYSTLSFRLRQLVQGFLFLGLLVLGEVGASEPGAVELSDGVGHLKALELQLCNAGLIEGEPQWGDLTQYYWAANPELRWELERAKRAFTPSGRGEYRGLTLIAGPAGIGKTFIQRHVFDADIPSEVVWKVDIRELYEDFREQGLAVSRPDLQDGERVFNHILALTPAGREVFVSHVQASEAQFLVLDSLDEIHPKDYVFVLKTLESLIDSSQKQFLQVVVFGRPFAFLDYWQQRGAVNQKFSPVHGFMLRKPQFVSTGDLQVSNWNFDCWKFGLKRRVQGEMQDVKFTDYQRWCETGFCCEGEFADVCHEENRHMSVECRETLERWISQRPVVACLMPNLAANGMVRQILDEHLQSGREFDERRFMDRFLALWLERDTRSDDRPSQIKPKHLDAYLELLETVAAGCAGKVQRDGTFSIENDADVRIDVGGEEVSVPIATVLNRSGLVTLNPFENSVPRYRFEPFWLHRLLAEMHGERHAGQDDRTPQISRLP